MKKITIVLIIGLITGYGLVAQVAINNDGSDPDSTAMLDIQSNNRGVSIPQLTQSEIENMESPANGLTVFNTTDSKFYTYILALNEWKEIAFGEKRIYVNGQFNCGDIFYDPRDGQGYKTVLIGDQCWMGENMNIGEQITGGEPMTNNFIYEKYCYDDVAANCDSLGGLYSWYEAMQYSQKEITRGICPELWHIASDDEWKILEGTADSLYPIGDPMWEQEGGRGYDAAKNLKSTYGWNGENGADLFGFKVLPSGYYTYEYLTYVGLSNTANFWTSSLNRDFHYYYIYIFRNQPPLYTLKYGKSVRCILDHNHHPYLPKNPNPSDLSHNIKTTSSLLWTCSDPDEDILTYNIYLDTLPNPSLLVSHHPDTIFTPGSLLVDKTYYWKIVAIDNHGDSTESMLWSFTTSWVCGDSLVDDRDGKVYATIQIGDQCWMAENLNYGSMINGNQSMSDDGNPEKYCYSDDPGNCEEYGGLYQWDEAMNYSSLPGTKGLCPEGWHIPEDLEWCETEQFLDPTITCESTGYRGVDGGGKLKEEGTVHWQSPNTGATNESGFTALPAGIRHVNGNFVNLSSNSLFWSSHEEGSDAWHRVLVYNSSQVKRSPSSKQYGFSLRCVKNDAFYGWDCGDPWLDERDGQIYNTTQIGDQCWMAENLNVGSKIDLPQNMTDNGVIEKYCYDNDPANCNIYGGLYSFDEATHYTPYSVPQDICPEGFHMPTDTEWKILEGTVDSQYPVGDPEWDNFSYRGFDAGLNLKSTTGWGNGNGTDLYGFNALPGGQVNGYDIFQYLGSGAYFFSTYTENYTRPYYRKLRDWREDIDRYGLSHSYPYSIRCVMDGDPINSPPALPSNPVPAHDTIDVYINCTLSWDACNDPDGDPVFYKIYFEKEDSNPNLLEDSCTVNQYNVGLLEYNTRYYWRIIAIDANYFSTEGPVWSFKTETDPCGGVFLDERDGKNYATIKIGDQCWMAENLNYGTMINGNQQMTNNGVPEKYCYGDNTSNCDEYGGLYQWDEAMDYSNQTGVQGLCPEGWHLPGDDEWCTMEQYLDPTITCGSTGFRGTDGGGQMKETGTSHWQSPNTGATNNSGFTALPGGLCNVSGSFANINSKGNWWTSLDTSDNLVWRRELSYNSAQVGRYTYDKEAGFGIRCVRGLYRPSLFIKRYYGHGGDDVPKDFIITHDGKIAMAGYTTSFGNSLGDELLLVTSEDGIFEWGNAYGYYGSSANHCNTLMQTSDHEFVLAGRGSGNVLLRRLEEDGDVIWQETFNFSGTEVCYDVMEDTDGSYVLIGYTDGFGNGAEDILWFKVDKDRNYIWGYAYGQEETDIGEKIIRNSNGGFAFCGLTYSYGNGESDMKLNILDAGGSTIHGWSYGWSEFEGANDLIQTSNHNYVLAGYTNSFGFGSYDFCLMKTDSAGNSLWAKAYGGTDWDQANAIIETSDHCFMMCGTTNSFGAYESDIWLIKTDQEGQPLWHSIIEYSSRTLEGVTVRQGPDDNYYVLGNHIYNSDTSFLLLKVSPDGSTCLSNFGDNSENGEFKVTKFTDCSGIMKKMDLSGKATPLEAQKEIELNFKIKKQPEYSTPVNPSIFTICEW